LPGPGRVAGIMDNYTSINYMRWPWAVGID